MLARELDVAPDGHGVDGVYQAVEDAESAPVRDRGRVASNTTRGVETREQRVAHPVDLDVRAVGVGEPELQLRAEVGDDAVARTAVADPAAARRTPPGMARSSAKWSRCPRPSMAARRDRAGCPRPRRGAARAVAAHGQDGVAERRASSPRRDGRAEHLGVERAEAVDVLGDDRDVVDAVDQHGFSSRADLATVADHGCGSAAVRLRGVLAVLGPVVVEGPSGGVPVPGRKNREVLALLALAAPRPITAAGLADRLWDEPPPSAIKTVRERLAGPHRARRGRGPRLDGGPLATGSSPGPPSWTCSPSRTCAPPRVAGLAGHDHDAANWLAEARRRWRGEPELPATHAGEAERARLAEEHLLLVEDHLAAEVAAGRPAAALPTAGVDRRHPLRERL